MAGQKQSVMVLVCGYVRMLLRFEDPPDLLVLHVGGNDLGQVPLGDLRFNIHLCLEDIRSVATN